MSWKSWNSTKSCLVMLVLLSTAVGRLRSSAPVELHFLPVDRNVAAVGADLIEILVVVEVVVTVHLYALAHAGADEVHVVAAAATQGENGVGRVDDAHEHAIAAVGKLGVVGRAVILKVDRLVVVIDDAIALDDTLGRVHVKLDGRAGGYPDFVLAARE